MAKNATSGMGRFILLLLGMLCLIFTVLVTPAVVALFDPSPPLSETMVASLQRGQIFFLGSAAFFLSLFFLAGKATAGRFFDRNAVLNALLVIGALLPFLAAEVALRPMMRKADRASIFLPDDTLGWRLRPGTQAFFANTPVQINEQGWRGTPVAEHKPDTLLRILFLGDSVTFGHGVEADTALFPYRTGRYLSDTLGQPVETINFGVPAYMPWQELHLLEHEGLRYQPDLVVLGFVLNDVSEKLDYNFWQEDKMRSNVTLSWLNRWARRSALVWSTQVIGRRLRIGGMDLVAKQIDEVERLIDDADHPEVQQVWEDTFATLDDLIAFCETHDIPLLIVAFPFKFQLDDPDGLAIPQQQLATYAQEQHLSYLDLLPPLAETTRHDTLTPDVLFLDHDHLSVTGHEMAAQQMARFIATHNLLATAPSNKQARHPEDTSPVKNAAR